MKIESILYKVGRVAFSVVMTTFCHAFSAEWIGLDSASTPVAPVQKKEEAASRISPEGCYWIWLEDEKGNPPAGECYFKKDIILDDKVAIQALNFARHKALSLRSSGGVLPSPRAPFEVASSRLHMTMSPRKPGSTRETYMNSLIAMGHRPPTAPSPGRQTGRRGAVEPVERERPSTSSSSLSMPSMPWMRQLIPPGKEDLLVVRVRSGMAPVTPRTMMRTQKDRKKTAALLTAASNVRG